MFIQMDVYIFVNAKDIYNFERVIFHERRNPYPIHHFKIHKLILRLFFDWDSIDSTYFSWILNKYACTWVKDIYNFKYVISHKQKNPYPIYSSFQNLLTTLNSTTIFWFDQKFSRSTLYLSRFSWIINRYIYIYFKIHNSTIIFLIEIWSKIFEIHFSLIFYLL